VRSLVGFKSSRIWIVPTIAALFVITGFALRVTGQSDRDWNTMVVAAAVDYHHSSKPSCLLTRSDMQGAEPQS